MDNLQRKSLQAGTLGSIIRSWKVHRPNAPGGALGWLGAVLAVICVMLVAVKVAMACTSAGSVTVTSPHMGSFSFNPVEVSKPATSGLSAGYTPPSGVSEGDLSATYAWSVTKVQYKKLDADSFGLPGNYHAKIKQASSSSGGATLIFTPLVAGYWQVFVSCSVAVTDTKTNQCWSGSANAGPQDLTSATVSFSPNPIKTGASKTDPVSIFVPVTATVAPADLVGKVNVANFTTLPGGTGAAAVENYHSDSSTGQITLDVYGTAGTAPSMPNGDVEIEGKDGSAVLGSALVSIEIPKAIGTPHPQVDPGVAVTPQNINLSAGSIPEWAGVPAGDVLLGTLVETALPVPVVDQFGRPLSSLYNKQEVYEDSGSGLVGINVEINNGVYEDHVGFEGDNGQQSLVAAGSPQAIAWPSSNQHDNIASPVSRTTSVVVRIAGFTLNPSVVNRTVSYNKGVLTVTWP
jgi:hypothetical protein